MGAHPHSPMRLVHVLIVTAPVSAGPLRIWRRVSGGMEGEPANVVPAVLALIMDPDPRARLAVARNLLPPPRPETASDA